MNVPQALVLTWIAVAGIACEGTNPESPQSVANTGSPVAALAPVTADQTPTGPGTQALPSGAYPSTHSGGYFQISQVRTLSLNTNETVLGYAVSGAQFLMFMQVTQGGGIQRWRILSTPTQPGTGIASWSVLCDLLGDGTSRMGFAVDPLYYYLPGGIPADPYHDQYLRRYRRSDCTEAAPLDVAQDFGSTSINPYLYSLASNTFRFALDLQNQLTLGSWDVSTGARATLTLTSQWAGSTLSYAYSVQVTQDCIWVLTYSALWKLDLQGHVLAWAALPGSSPYSLQGSKAVVPIDAGQVVVISAAYGGISRTYLDVSHF